MNLCLRDRSSECVGDSSWNGLRLEDELRPDKAKLAELYSFEVYDFCLMSPKGLPCALTE